MALKILSVDDEVDLEMLLTQYFRRKIRKGEYEFYFAHNGLEALKVYAEHPDIEVILSDINMPEMDGLTLLSKLNQMMNPALKCIMVSAYGDMQNIRQAMNNGAFDFATKPIDLEELEHTIEKAKVELERIIAAQKEHAELSDLKGDLDVAREIQQHILPMDFNINENIDLFASMNAAKDVGGDFYDFFQIDEDHIGFTIADVSGKGIPAALFMAVSRTVIKAIGTKTLSAGSCMADSNDLLCPESYNSMFVTVFYGVLNVKTGAVKYCNAGHNPPYVLRANGELETLPSVGNLILGAMEGMPYTECDLQLNPGDKLITFTDGVTEAMNPDYVEMGEAHYEEMLKTLTGKASKRIVEETNELVRRWADGAPQSDDVTVLVIGMK